VSGSSIPRPTMREADKVGTLVPMDN
jgi:hypothetical protein